MIEYLIVAAIVAWAAYFLWKRLRPPGKGCSCGSSCGCDAAGKNGGSCCQSNLQGIQAGAPKKETLSGGGAERRDSVRDRT